MSDHYSTLGVTHDASPEEIKKAYRRLASEHHPDKGGSTEKFQEIQAAYSVLGDEQKRAEYNQPRGNHFNFEFNTGPAGFDFNNIFSMFGQHFHPHQQRQQQHVRMSLWVSLQDIAQGGQRPVNIGTSHGTITIEIEIPMGINDGDNVQYAGLGPGGTDLIINFRIHQNPKWERNGLNLTTNHNVSIWDCLVGAETVVKDILNNQITLTVPPLTQPGSLLRLKGKGLPSRNGPTGDLLVRIQAQVPSYIDPELVEKIKQIQKK
jgi:DnaJ-class molecular chaperone